MKLTILHTNDLHGHVARLAQLSSMAKQLRREVAAAGGATLLVDAGDAEEKSLLESDVTKGAAVMALLSSANYEAMAVGNGGPLSYGPQALAPMAASASFPLLAANMTWSDGRGIVNGVTPAVVLDAGGVLVGLIGLAPTFRFWSDFGVEVTQGQDEVREWRDRLRAAGAQVVVVLSHQGSRSDRELAGAVDGLDVIIGGHAHETLPDGLWEGQTLICRAGDYGRFLGRVDLEIDDITGRITHKAARLLPLDEQIKPDPAVLAEYARQQEMVAELLRTPIGESLAPLEHDPLRESAMANLLADVLRERMGTEISLCISGSLTQGLPGGEITLGDLCAACSSPGNPGRTLLSGSQVREMLDLGLDRDRARLQPGFLRGRPLGLLAISGLRVHWNPLAPLGRRIQQVWVGDEPLQDDRLYSVAASDFEMGGMTYAGLQDEMPGLSYAIPPEDVEYDLPTVLREALQDYINRHSPLAPPDVERLVVCEQG